MRRSTRFLTGLAAAILTACLLAGGGSGVAAPSAEGMERAGRSILPGAPKGAQIEPEVEEPEVDDEERERLLEQVRGLGYVTWDLRADPNLTGVTRHDAARTAPGYNLYTDNGKKIYLMDLEGRHVRTWVIDNAGKTYTHAEILPDGRIALLFDEHGLGTFDWNGRPIWKIEMPAHHDFTLLPGGSLMTLEHEKSPYKGRVVLFDAIVSLSAEGEVTGRWKTFDHLEEIRKHHPPSHMDQEPMPEAVPAMGVSDYYHMNSLEPLPATALGARDRRFREGNLLVSFRNVSLIAVLDRDDLSIVWSWGPGTLEYQHMPTMLPDGHILLFDNGPFRGYSRVLEIEPASKKIVWSYESDPRDRFLSKEGGGNQRLPNGNTLICETDRGHAFEVTRGGEIVWEYWNPELVRGKRSRFYRFTRVPPGLVEPLLGVKPR